MVREDETPNPDFSKGVQEGFLYFNFDGPNVRGYSETEKLPSTEGHNHLPLAPRVLPPCSPPRLPFRSPRACPGAPHAGLARR